MRPFVSSLFAEARIKSLGKNVIRKQDAENLIKELDKQKNPQVYCIINYSAPFVGEFFVVCDSSNDYDNRHDASSFYPNGIVWKSEKFKKDHSSVPDCEL